MLDSAADKDEHCGRRRRVDGLAGRDGSRRGRLMHDEPPAGSGERERAGQRKGDPAGSDPKESVGESTTYTKVYGTGSTATQGRTQRRAPSSVRARRRGREPVAQLAVLADRGRRPGALGEPANGATRNRVPENAQLTCDLRSGRRAELADRGKDDVRRHRRRGRPALRPFATTATLGVTEGRRGCPFGDSRRRRRHRPRDRATPQPRGPRGAMPRCRPSTRRPD